nr:MAG TPA_asm: hypothetical protein [Caudoviricetes sp.]
MHNIKRYPVIKRFMTGYRLFICVLLLDTLCIPHARQLVSSGPYGRQNRKAECQYRHLNPCAAGKTCDAISICTAVNSIYKQKYTKN